jgi:CheY-like chemotaxis protein
MIDSVTEPKALTILLVEDNDDHAHIVTRNLKKESFVASIPRVCDGVEALKYLRREKGYEDSVLPDVILLDLKLPKLDGHEVLVEIKADPKLRLIPAIILTTSDAEIDKFKAYENYANSYLVKPLDPGALKQMIESMCYYWGQWNKTF